MHDLNQYTDVELLALLIAGESDNQPLAGQVAVAMTVLERFKRQRAYYGLTIRDIMLKRYQYSTFNGEHWKRFVHRIPVYTMLAQLALDRLLVSPMPNATHFCRFDLKPLPRWTQPRYSVRLGQIGDHVFYSER